MNGEKEMVTGLNRGGLGCVPFGTPYQGTVTKWGRCWIAAPWRTWQIGRRCWPPSSPDPIKTSLLWPSFFLLIYVCGFGGVGGWGFGVRWSLLSDRGGLYMGRWSLIFESIIFVHNKPLYKKHTLSVKKSSAAIKTGRNFSHSPIITIENKGFENFKR